MKFKVDCFDNTSDLNTLRAVVSPTPNERETARRVYFFDFAIRNPGDLRQQRHHINACKREISY